MSITIQKEYVEIDDYVKMQDRDEWLRVTYKHEHSVDGFDAVDDFGTPVEFLKYSDIEDLKLESEMEYNF